MLNKEVIKQLSDNQLAELLLQYDSDRSDIDTPDGQRFDWTSRGRQLAIEHTMKWLNSKFKYEKYQSPFWNIMNEEDVSNLSNDIDERLTSEFKRGVDIGITHSIDMILEYRHENVHTMSFKEYHMIREIIEYIKENA